MQTENKKPKIWQSALLCITAFLLLIFAGGYAQERLGFYGSIVIQINMLLLAIGFVLITKSTLKEAFLFEKPTFRKTFGAIFMYMGTYLFIMCVTLSIAYLFPEEYFKLSEDLVYSFSDRANPIGVFLVVSFLPAICEELFFRGALSYGLRGLKPWVIIICIGVIFGIFHTDIIRFFPTAILGILFTYIYLKTKNLFYPMLLHFINNAISSVALLFAEQNTMQSSSEMLSVPLSALGVYFVLCAACPFIINASNKLFDEKKPVYYNPYLKYSKENKKLLITAVIAALFALTGILMMRADLADRPKLTQREEIIQIQSNEVHADTIEFTNDVYNVYNIYYQLKTQHGLAEIKLMDPKGNVIVSDICHEGSFSYAVPLDEGTYTIEIESHIDDVWEYAKKKGLDYTKEGDLIKLNMGYDSIEECELYYKIVID